MIAAVIGAGWLQAQAAVVESARFEIGPRNADTGMAFLRAGLDCDSEKEQRDYACKFALGTRYEHMPSVKLIPTLGPGASGLNWSDFPFGPGGDAAARASNGSAADAPGLLQVPEPSEGMLAVIALLIAAAAYRARRASL